MATESNIETDMQREFEEHRRAVREDHEEVRRRGEEFDARLKRGARQTTARFRL